MDPKILGGLAAIDFSEAKGGTTDRDIYKLAEGLEKLAQSIKVIAERQEAIIRALRNR